MKKKLSLLLVLVLVVGIMAACSSGSDEETSSSSSSSDDIVTLKWITVGNGMPDNYDAWLENINAYLGEKIGVNLDMQVVSWGDWENRRSVIANSSEPFDILFTDSSRYNSEVNLGLYYDLTDLLQDQGKDLYDYIPEDYWTAVSVNGSIYSVPSYKDSSATEYTVWDKSIVDKYDIDYESMDSLQDMTDALTTIKDGENTAPFELYKNGSEAVLFNYDQMGVGLPAMGVRFDDETGTVVNVLKQDDVLENLRTLHDWYEDGIVNMDAPTIDERSGYRMVFTAQGWPAAAETTWGPNIGAEVVAHQLSETIVSNTTVRGSLNAISVNTEYPEKCIELLQLVNLDSYVRDAFYYGLEGDDFEYDDDGKVVRLSEDWSMAGYTQGTFFTVTPLASDDSNQWEQVKTLNEEATPSVLLGFNLDTSSMETELANCRAIYEKYKSELLTGARDADEITDDMTQELDAAGFQTILEETQSQVDEFLGK